MNVEDIKSLVVEALQRPELTLQVNQTGDNLSIVINRPKDLKVDYVDLSSQILKALLENLSPEDLTGIRGTKFFGRIKGQPKQEWQTWRKLSDLAQKKVELEPIPEVNLQNPPVVSPPAQQPLNLQPSPSTVSQYPSAQVPIDSSKAAWELVKNFKFGELLTTFKDIISTGALVGIFLILLTNSLAGQKTKSVEWEYTIEAVPDLTFTETMDRYGKSGWELVTARRAVDEGTASYECIFKRVKN